ncbi:MAG: oxidoreductase, partial [Microscillaceae bacterium]|nr:oxidoreductase [Microscillaceae bacterium]
MIAGATGLTGTFLLDFLLEDHYYDKIVVLSRRSTGRKVPHLEEHCLDFEQLPQLSLPYPVQDVFSCLGITRRRAGSVEKARRVEYDYPLQLAQWGLRHEARQFLCVSSQGANPQARHYYFRTKGQLEEALKSLAYPTLHLLRPTLLTGPRNEIRLAET